MNRNIASKGFIAKELTKLRNIWNNTPAFYDLMAERMMYHSYTEEEVQYAVYVATEDPNRDYLRIAHIIQPVLDRRENK